MSELPGAPLAVWLDRGLALLAGLYFLLVAAGSFGPAVYSSAEAVVNGRLWLLLTSALDADGPLSLLQVMLAAAIAAFVIKREGPRLWWLAALGAHVGSALLAYGVIGLAVGLGSDDAKRVADDPDYGVSCVLAGSLGAMFASGLLARFGRQGGVSWESMVRNRPRNSVADDVAVVGGAAGFVGTLTIAFGWYDMEHPLAFMFGAGVIWLAHRRDARPNAQHPPSSSV